MKLWSYLVTGFHGQSGLQQFRRMNRDLILRINNGWEWMNRERKDECWIWGSDYSIREEGVCAGSGDFLVNRGFSKDDFSIQFHHGGNLVQDGSLEVYIGGVETQKSHFDFFDLIDEIKQLSYAKWSRVAFKVPKGMKMIDIKDDKDVMVMLSYLQLRICVLHVYVVGGELGEPQVEEAEGSVGGKEADGFFSKK
ncbi:hypothetical protein SASPL_150312 [Salvia splendens]|uniref:PB1-like domain-containing protein n=1 Tax=Salvia splendens TaxID=180675 RepID=A0A8X8W780_SALSN|nr:hypothetical protein SASPL_150312 [Salvia splendens]